MNLPFQPESTDALKERYPAAVKHPLNPFDLMRRAEFPGHNRKHVFDFADGYRLQVTLTDLSGLGKHFVQVSGRRWYDDNGHEIIKSPSGMAETEQKAMKQEIVKRFHDLSGLKHEPCVDIITPISFQFMFLPQSK